MPAKPITGRKAPLSTVTVALDKVAEPAVPDTKLSAAFQTALGGGHKQAHLSLPGHANVKTVERGLQNDRAAGKGAAGHASLSAGFDARRGHK